MPTKSAPKNIPLNVDSCTNMKETNPEFYRDGSSLQYGKAPKLPEENIDKMDAGAKKDDNNGDV